MAVATVSTGSSGRVLAWMRIILRRLGHPGLADRLTMHIVRKLAHFCEYMLEGFLLMLCMRVYSRHPLRHITVPMLGGVLTALTDETIQLFSEGRSSQVTDVWLDSAGVLAGILAVSYTHLVHLRGILRQQAAQQQTVSFQLKCAGVAHDPSSPFYKNLFLGCI